MIIINEIVKKFYTEQILIEACSLFDLDRSKVNLIRGQANLIFDCQDKILRLTHSEIRSYHDIETEIDWLTYLLEQGLSVAGPIKSKKGNPLERVGGENYFTAVCFEKIIGTKINKELWGKTHFTKLGKFVGQMHRIGNGYIEKPKLIYKNWNEIIEYKNQEELADQLDEYAELFEALIIEFDTYEKTRFNYEIIHYDIHRGNYLLTKKTKDIVLFDFEMTCRSWYIGDVSAVVYYAKNFPTSRNDENFIEDFLTSFLKGYNEEYTLGQNEIDKIPKFLLYRDLLVLAFVSKMWDIKNLNSNQKRYLNSLEKSISIRKHIL